LGGGAPQETLLPQGAGGAEGYGEGVEEHLACLRVFMVAGLHGRDGLDVASGICRLGSHLLASIK
jgi:hypothetical protein